MPKVFLFAGEPSGDAHGAALVKALKTHHSKLEVIAWGGDKMEAAGARILLHINRLSFMGFVEVLLHLPQIRRNFNQAKADLQRERPDAVIFIDFPGFNLRLAKTVKTMGITCHYYIAPQAWAWNQSRVKQIRDRIDHLHCILPFEVDFFEKHGIPARFVGNPVAEHVNQFEFQLLPPSNKPLIAVLPGSRRSEVSRIMPAINALAELCPKWQFAVATVPWLPVQLYKANSKINLVADNTFNLVRSAAAAVVTSGTATLETALIGTPQVVVYKADALSVAIARRLVKVPFISLVNLVAGRAVVTELIQHQVQPKIIADELEKLLNDTQNRQQHLTDYRTLHEALGTKKPSQLVAKSVLKSLGIET